MNKPFTSLWLALILVLANLAAASATTLDLASAGVGARPMGMGKAFVALADDANAVFLNPAGLALSDKIQATSMSANLTQMIDYKMAAGSLPTAYGTLGFGYITLSSPAGYLTTDKTSLAGAAAVNYGASQLTVSYARNSGNVAAGANFKMINNNFSGAFDGSGTGYGLDLGALVKLDRDCSLGLNLQNVLSSVAWKNSADDSLPMTLKVGAADRFADGRVVLAADLDYAFAENRPFILHSGLEVKPVNFATLRAGVDQYAASPDNVATNFTAGVGLNFSGVSFDYAYHDDQQVKDNATHYFSISVVMEDLLKNNKKAEIAPPANILTASEDYQKAMGIIAPKSAKTGSDKSLAKANGDILSYYR